MIKDTARIRALPTGVSRLNVLLLLVLAVPALALAQAPEESFDIPPDPIDSYLRAIEKSETEGGAYAVELADLYQGLAKSLMDSGEYDAARDAFHQGVQVVRVNSGPFSLEQVNYLYSIANIETLVGDNKAAAKVLNSIYNISAFHFGEDSPQMLPVLNRMYDWYMEQRPLYSPYATYSDFERTEYLAGRMAELTEREKGLGHPDTAKVYRMVGQIHFMTVRYVLSRGVSIEPGVVMSTGTPQPPQIQEVSVRDHFRSGTEAFERYTQAVAATEGVTPTEMAEAMAQFGDWYLVFQKYQSARDKYETAYRILSESEGSTALADEYMGQPSPVRFMNNHDVFTIPGAMPEVDAIMGEAALVSEELEVGALGEPVDAPSLKVSMTVTRSGDLRNIEILNAPEYMSKDQLNAIEEQLEVTRFRPGIVNGEVVKIEEFVWVYTRPIEMKDAGI